MSMWYQVFPGVYASRRGRHQVRRRHSRIARAMLLSIFILTLIVGPAAASVPAPRLIFSHACATPTDLEVHFIVNQFAGEVAPDANYGAVTYGGLVDSVPITATAPFDKRTDKVIHYLTALPTGNTLEVVTATVTITPTTGISLTLTLENPKTVAIGSCNPTAVSIKSFTANKKACKTVNGTAKVMTAPACLVVCKAAVRLTIEGQTYTDIMTVKRGTKQGDTIRVMGSWCGGDDLQLRQK